MRAILSGLLIAWVVACNQAQTAVEEDDGRAPIICFTLNGMQACRDKLERYWICRDRCCMRVTTPQELFKTAPVSPEH